MQIRSFLRLLCCHHYHIFPNNLIKSTIKSVIKYTIYVLIFSTTSVWNIHYSKKELDEILPYTYIGFCVKYPLFLSYFNKTWIFAKYFRKILQYQISWKSVQWEPSPMWTQRDGQLDGQTDRQTDWHEEASNRFSQILRPCVKPEGELARYKSSWRGIFLFRYHTVTVFLSEWDNTHQGIHIINSAVMDCQEFNSSVWSALIYCLLQHMNTTIHSTDYEYLIGQYK
jgi:hypothetical protein